MRPKLPAPSSPPRSVLGALAVLVVLMAFSRGIVGDRLALARASGGPPIPQVYVPFVVDRGLLGGTPGVPVVSPTATSTATVTATPTANPCLASTRRTTAAASLTTVGQLGRTM